MKNILDKDRDMWIVSELNKLRREFTESKYNQPLTIERVNIATAGPFTVANNAIYKESFTISSTTFPDKVLFIMFEPSFFKTSAVGANRYPHGANWTDAEVLGFNYTLDYDFNASDGKNLVLYMAVKNTTGSSIDLYYNLGFRYIVGTV